MVLATFKGALDREIMLNISLIIFSSLLVLALFEGALHLGVVDTRATSAEGNDTFQTERIFCGDTKGVRQPHPRYGTRAVPNSTYLEKRTPKDDWSIFRINKHGFRDVYDSGQEGSIIVLGDSHTRGTLVDQNATFAHLLERWTPRKSVHNFGTSGYSTLNELSVYEDVEERDHDVVILAYYLGNDAKENLERSSDYGYVDGTFRKLPKANNSKNNTQSSVSTVASIPTHVENSPTTQSAQRLIHSGIISGPVLDQIQNYLFENTATYRYIAPRLKEVLFKLGIVEPPANRQISTEQIPQQLKITKKSIVTLGQKASQRDAEVVILVIPRAIEIRWYNPILRGYWEKQRDMLRDVANNQSNVRVVEIKQQLKEMNRGGKHVYGRINTHLDDRGHQVAARQLYVTLANMGYVEQGKMDFGASFTSKQTTCSG